MLQRHLFAGILTILAAVSQADAKGPADLIVVSGGGLRSAIEITDSSLLRSFNPWGDFADWTQPFAKDAPCFRRSVEVVFYKKWPGRKSQFDRGDLKMIYATRYCSTESAGYVYLPGHTEPQYRSNIGTIYRGELDGKWFLATSAWNSFLQGAIAGRLEQGTVDEILVSGGELQEPVKITDPDTLRKFSPWTGNFIEWDKPSGEGRMGWEYEVLFLKRGMERATSYDQDGMNLIYGIRYCMNEDGGPGFIALAGRDDKFGPENIGMVWDGAQAGKWHRATPDWNQFIRALVDEQRKPRAENREFYLLQEQRFSSGLP